MQAYADKIMRQLGSTGGLLLVVDDKRTIAGTIGCQVNFGESSYHVGVILVNVDYCNANLTDRDMRFVLAHECSHIFKSHYISMLFWNLLEKYLKGERNENYELIEWIKLGYRLLSRDRLPPNAVSLRDQEYEADESAVNLTQDLNGAIDCLKKLVGYDLSKQSHGWELFDSIVPAMTMGERIAELERRFANQLFPSFPKF
jgi:hypothetical protein